MAKSLSLFCFLLLACSLAGHEYLIRYQSLTSGTIYHVETVDGIRVGKVVREQKGDRDLYTFFSKGEEPQARGQTQKYKSDTIVSIEGSPGEAIGWFSAEIYNLYPTEYKVFTTERRLIAKGFMNWLGNSFALTDPNNSKRYLVTFLRPRFKLFNDHWHFQIHENGIIDFRLLCILGAFQTACDLKFEGL